VVAAEVEEGSVVVVEVEAEVVEAEAVAEEEANKRQQWHQPPILLGMASKECPPPSSKETPRCLICSNKNGDCTKQPMSIMMT
jgi:hypothetical protein